MRKTAPITELLNFKVLDNCVEIGDKKVFCFRYYPPNTAIFTESELRDSIFAFQRLLDSLAQEITFFTTDKVEDLQANKEYWESRDRRYYHLTSDIIKSIESIEVGSASVQKATYIILTATDLEKVQAVYNTLKGLNFNCYLADKRELTLLLRNFILREFLNFDIYQVENELGMQFEEKVAKKKLSKNSKEAFFSSELTKRLVPLRFDIQPKHIVQNNVLRKIILIKNIPTSQDLCRLKPLAQLRNTTFCMRLSPMSKHLMNSLVNNQINNRRATSSRNKATLQIDAEEEEKNIKEFYRQISADNNQIYYTNIYIEVYGTDKADLKKNMENVDTILRGLSITYENLDHYQKEGFLGVSPLGADSFVNLSNNIPSNSLAMLYPFSFSGRCDPQGLCLGQTEDGGNVFLDLWLWQKSITNGNYSIIGQSGQGKSWLQKKIISQMIMCGISTFVLDPEDEYIEMIEKLGGTVINCADGKVKINPFEVRRLRTLDDDSADGETADAFKQSKVFFQHLSWLKDFFQVIYPGINSREADALMVLVQDVYKQHGIDEETNFDKLSSKDYITYTDVYEYIYEKALHRDKQEYIFISDEIFSSLLLMLKDTYDGSLAFLFNGQTNIENDKIICFALCDLLSGSESRTEAVLFNIMTYVWNRIALRQDRILFCVDELYLLMNSIIANYLKDFTKRARKYNAIIGTATQNLTDLLESQIKHIAAGIFANTAFKFLFYPGEVDFEKTKSVLQLSDGEAKKISVSNKAHCLLKAGADKYYMEVGQLPYEEYLFGQAGGK